MKTTFTFLLSLAITIGFSQGISFEIRGNYQQTILKETLNKAKTMTDINPGYPSSWVSGYISAEIMATCNGKYLKAVSPNDTLSRDQINLINNADIGTRIFVEVKYNPSQSRNEADIQMVKFDYTIIPETEAHYPGGYDLLKNYLKENAIDKIPQADAQKIEFAIIKFMINEEGRAANAKISESSGNNNIDELLLETIQKMQKWEPAKNAQGEKLSQEFELIVGMMAGC